MFGIIRDYFYPPDNQNHLKEQIKDLQVESQARKAHSPSGTPFPGKPFRPHKSPPLSYQRVRYTSTGFILVGALLISHRNRYVQNLGAFCVVMSMATWIVFTCKSKAS